MPTGYGFQGICGVGKEGTWGTPVVATQKIPIISSAFTRSFSQVMSHALIGVHGRSMSGRGAAAVAGTLMTHLTYGARLFLLERFFGTFTDNASPPDEYGLDPTTEGVGLTIAVQRGVSVLEVAGFKPNVFTLSGSNADGFHAGFTGMFKSTSISSATNTTTVLNALADPSKHCLYEELTLQIGAIGGALTAFSPDTMSLTLNRNQVNATVNAYDPLEPLENDFLEGTLQVVLPRHTTDQFITWHQTYVPLMAIISISDGVNTKEFRINRMIIPTDPSPQVDGPALLKSTINFTLFHDKGNTNAHASFPFLEAARCYET